MPEDWFSTGAVQAVSTEVSMSAASAECLMLDMGMHFRRTGDSFFKIAQQHIEYGG